MFIYIYLIHLVADKSVVVSLANKICTLVENIIIRGLQNVTTKVQKQKPSKIFHAKTVINLGKERGKTYIF